MQQAPSVRTGPDVSQTVEGRPVRVLIVDGDHSVRSLVRASLAQVGWKVSEASSAEEGLEQFRKHSPDLVLVDLALPNDDGFEVCSRIRDFTAVTTPILVMTHASDRESAKRAHQVGATDFVGKPMNYTLLPYRLQAMLGASRSIEELKARERQLKRAQGVARLGSWELDSRGSLISVSDEALRLFGIARSDFRGYYNTLLRRVHTQDRLRVHKFFLSALDGIPQSLEHRIVGDNQKMRIVRQETEIATGPAGETIAIGTIQDITELRRAQEKLIQLHYYDSLTGLPNELYLQEHVDQWVHHGGPKHVAVLAIKILNLKRLNSSFGRVLGNDLLGKVAGRLATLVHSAAEPGGTTPPDSSVVLDLLARTGGGEFAVVFPFEGSDALETFTADIDERLSEPFEFDGHRLVLESRIGVACFPDAGNNAAALLENARDALLHPDASSSIHFHSSELREQAKESFQLESDLRFALEREEFIVHYQPKVSLSTGLPVGVEALVRWEHPQRGLIPPGVFIPITEANGLILPLGEWVLRQAILDLEILSRETVPLHLSVNLSPRQFSDLNLLERIRRLLKDVSMPPGNLELEVTEGALIEDTQLGQQVLSELKELGLRVALDDFGTGFSSLAYLKRYPFDCVKIDRSFIQDICEDEASLAIVGSAIDLAQRLGKTVVAEGVETEAQLELLRTMNCDEVQGYYLCRPVPVDELLPWLNQHRTDSDPDNEP